MKKSKKIALITAFILIIVGATITLSTLSSVKFYFSKLSTQETVERSYDVENKFSDINISVADCNVEFVLSENGKCSVTYNGYENTHLDVSSNDGVLKIVSEKENEKWYDNIGVYNSNNKITVNLPEKNYYKLNLKTTSGSVNIPDTFSFTESKMNSTSGEIKFCALSDALNIQTTSGNINIDNINPKELNIQTTSGEIVCNKINVETKISVKSTSGEIELNDINSRNMDIRITSGKINLKNSIISEKINMYSTSGDINMEKCDADTLDIETTSGAAKGTLRTDKIFVTETSSGNINVPKTVSGGLCKIKTSSGDVDITIDKN